MCLAAVLGSASQASAGMSADLAETFAGCVGRFSAELEHAWLMNEPTADDLQGRRLTFISLLEASMPKGNARDILSVRIESKLAHASLLTAATFERNSELSHAAKVSAAAYLSACEMLILDG